MNIYYLHIPLYSAHVSVSGPIKTSVYTREKFKLDECPVLLVNDLH